ncbi:MAG: GAF domain-containing protein, partial [Anaerolineae bacterium]|nr:GAF domain-containing protein [Anaerolineae bacterium]
MLINRSLAREINRTSLLPQIIESIDQQKDIHSLLRMITEAMLLNFNFKTGLVGNRYHNQVSLVTVVGALPAYATPETWMGQHNPLRQALQDGLVNVVKNVHDVDGDWAKSPMIRSLDAQSFVCLPFVMDVDQTAGILLISDKASPALMDEDIHLFERIVHLVSVRLKQLQILNETEKRLNEVNLLLDFTQNLTQPGESVSSLTPQRILNRLLETMLRVMPNAQAGWVAMWDLQEQCLTPVVTTGFVDPASFLKVKFRDNPNFAENLLPLQIYYSGLPYRAEEIHFAQDYRLPSSDLILYDQATNQRVPESSMFVPFHQGDKISGVLVLDNYEIDAAFSEQNETLAISLMHQAVLVLENARLFGEAEERTTQLKHLTNASAAISSSLNTGELMDKILYQLKSILPFDTATLWMRDEDELVIASAAGFDDNLSRIGLKVSIEDSILFREILQTGDAILAPDIRLDRRFPALLEPENLCWLGIPLKTSSKLIGMIALEKKEAGFYSIDQVQILQTFAGQAVAALENARLYEESEDRAVELNLRTQRLSILDQLSSELGALIDVDAILNATSQQLLSALNVNAIGVAVDDEDGVFIKLHIPDSRQLKLPLRLPQADLFENLKESRGIFISNNPGTEEDLADIYDFYFAGLGTRSLLMIPLIITGRVYGWLLVQNNIPYRFNMQEIELARTICNQAALAIQKSSLLEETRRLSADLERRVIERTTELQKEHQ